MVGTLHGKERASYRRAFRKAFKIKIGQPTMRKEKNRCIICGKIKRLNIISGICSSCLGR